MEGEKKLNLVCVDGSKYSEEAFRWYFSNYHRSGDRVGVCTVHELPYVPVGIYEDGFMLSEAAYPTMLEKSIADSKATCDKYKAMCADHNVVPIIFCKTCEESVGNTICKIAKQNNAATIIIGQRGLGTIRRTLLGSVSDYVIHHAHIPTVVVPPKEN